jgi:hypothetical protein
MNTRRQGKRLAEESEGKNSVETALQLRTGSAGFRSPLARRDSCLPLPWTVDDEVGIPTQLHHY